MPEPEHEREDDPDVRLMLAFQAGDDAAFGALFGRWARPLLRYLERMVRDPAAAEELVQEAFLRVHRARGRYAPEARFSTWLYRIATNLARNELRRPRRRHVHESGDLDGGDGRGAAAGRPARIEESVDARRLAERVERELAALPERQRSALWLAAVEGLSYAEVAAVLEATETSVKALVHRARSALAERIERIDRPEPAERRNVAG